MEPLAIIGIACRFPGAASREEFWDALCQGRDAITDVPVDRWDAAAFAGSTGVHWGGFIGPADRFDPYFFGISPREASHMDPQQRLLLEIAWEALEDAGLVMDTLAGRRVGVFVGISSFDYGGMQLGQPGRILDGYANTGGALSVAANRISYLFDFKGPSVAVDTACASSLAAAHFACRSLWNGECTLALAGGANMILSPALTIAFDKLQALSADGRCKTFDARADGYVRGEGAGLVVLKPLRAALADGDRIYAVVRGSAMNHNGRSNGLTAPNGLAQQAVIRAALEQAGARAAQIRYVEAHGTGTPLGDPIELTALGSVLAEGRAPGDRCAVGAVKTNIGHLEAAAGVAGLIKTALVLAEREIPPNLHFEQPNPYIPFDDLPLVVPTSAMPLEGNAGPALAGVSSFGFGGTNVHMILEEPPRPAASASATDDQRAVLLPLSARTEQALHGAAVAHRRFLEYGGPEDLESVAFSASCRRTHHDHRLTIVAASREEAVEQLDAFLAGEPLRRTASARAIPGRRRRVAFVFSGQGSQWLGMGRRLLETEPVFAEAWQRFDAAAREHGLALLDELAADESRSRLGDRVDVIQPAICGMQIALAALWRSWGVEPQAVAGHSMGEIAAAHVAGALGIDDAAKLSCSRGRVVKLASGQGAMAVVELSLADARNEVERYGKRLWVAGSNSPTSTLVSGEPAAVDEIVEQLTARDLFCRKIKVDYASHGRHVAPLCAELRRSIEGLAPRPVRVPFYSSVLGGDARDLPLDVDYWVRNLSEPVLFSDVVQRLLESGFDLIIEMSPHPVLVPAIEQGVRHKLAEAAVLGSERRDEDERAEMLASLGAAWAAGASVSWKALYPAGGTHVALPHYPWQRERFWFDQSTAPPPVEHADRPGHPLLGAAIKLGEPQGSWLWHGEISAARPAWLGEHRVEGSVVLPGAAQVEMALAAAAEVLGQGPSLVEALELTRPIVVAEQGSRTIQLVLSPGMPGRYGLRLFSTDDDVPVDHASGAVRRPSEADAAPADNLAALDEARTRCTDTQSAQDHYDAAAARGLDYGPAFRGIEEIQRGSSEAVARVQLPEALQGEASRYRIHPALLDACFQVLGAAAGDAMGEGAYVPVSIGTVWLGESGDLAAPLQVHATLREEVSTDTVTGDIVLHDEAGQPVAAIRSLRAKRLAATTRDTDQLLYTPEWRTIPAAASPAGSGTWVVLADRQGTAEDLCAGLERAGNRCVRVERERKDLDHLLADGCAGIVHLRSLDASEDRFENCSNVLTLIGAIARAAAKEPPRLVLVTRGSQAVAEHDRPDPDQALLWGLGATIALEHPELRCTLVDLDPRSPVDGATLCAEVLAAEGARRIAFRAGKRHAAILRRGLAEARNKQPTARVEAADYRLAMARPGVLDDLALRAAQPRPPGPGEVQIRVRAAGVNFRDVLLALGLLPSPEGSGVVLGFECAGTVTALGNGVVGLRLGDEVIAVARGAFGSSVTTAAACVAPKPHGLDLDQAATIPIPFLTAHYGLCQIGRLAPGERVLIHSAAGGVGLAALQVAKRVGAKIYATAGSEAKREFLRSLGVEHVSDSRSAQFVTDVLECTSGEGLDVVLNSLAGEAVGWGLSLLRPGGRFVELSKLDVLRGGSLRLQALENNVSFSTVDLDRLARERPSTLGAALRTALRFFSDEGLEPLRHEAVPITDAADALRTMAAARHMGRIVLTMPDRVPVERTSSIRADGTYLITGGLGGLGLCMARGLVERGATHLALLGRSEPTATAREQIAVLEAAGAHVAVFQADVASEEQLASALRDLRQRMPPLRGVVHCAGLLADGIAAQMSDERFREVMPPKVHGAKNLHTLTQGDPLELFVLFSSAAAVLGSPGQANYAAANAYLDALAHHRRALGLPALSIDWGPWAEVGLAARPDRGGRLAQQSIGSIRPQEGIAAFGLILDEGATQVCAIQVPRGGWRDLYTAAGNMPLLEALAREDEPATSTKRTDTGSLRGAVFAAPPAERKTILERHVREQVARVLRIPVERLDVDQRLDRMGIDSLMAVELKNRIEGQCGVTLPLLQLVDGPSVKKLAERLLDRMSGDSQTTEPATATQPKDDRSGSLLLSLLSMRGEQEQQEQEEARESQ